MHSLYQKRDIWPSFKSLIDNHDQELLTDEWLCLLEEGKPVPISEALKGRILPAHVKKFAILIADMMEKVSQSKLLKSFCRELGELTAVSLNKDQLKDLFSLLRDHGIYLENKRPHVSTQANKFLIMYIHHTCKYRKNWG